MSNAWMQLLITQTWQLSLVILIVGLLSRWLQKTQPHFAALLWLIVLAKAVTPPVWSSPVGLFSWSFPSVAENAVAVAEPANSPLVAVTAADETYSGRVDSLVTPQSAVEEPAKESAVQNSDGEDWGLADSIPDTLISPVAPFEGEVSGELDHLTEAPLSQPVQFIEAQPQPEINRGKSWPAFLPEAAVIVTVWFCGVVVMVLFTLVRFLWLMGRLARAGRVEDAALEALVQKLRQRLRIRQKVALWVTPTNRGPAVVGCRRPCLLLPLALTQIGPPHHLEPILAHELLHIRRGDLWLGWWQTAVQCVWWFHPLVWWANRSLTRLLERCCDDEVLAELDCAPAHYARSLLSTLELKHRLHPVPTAPGVRPVDLTRERMERIMRRQHGSRSRTPWWGWGLLALGLAITLPGAAKSLTADEPASESVPTPELEVIHVRGVGVNSENGVTGALTLGREPFPAASLDNHKKVWRHYNVEDVLRRDFGSYSSQSQQREAFLDEIVAMAIRNAKLWNNDPIAQYGQPSFRQIIWEGDQLKLQATAAEHAELAQILNARHADPADGQLAFSVETRWTVNTDEDLLKDFSWSDLDSDNTLPRRALLTTPRVKKLVQAWQSDGKTSLLFAPKITVHNGQVGSIQFVNQVPFLAERAGIEKPDTSRVGELSTWHVRPLKAGDSSVSLWLQMQRQSYANGDIFNRQSPGDSVSRPIVRKLEIHEHLQVGQHLLLQIPEGHGKSIVGLVSVTVVKPEPLSATSQHTAQSDPPTFQINPPNFQTKRPTFQKSPPNFQTKQPFLHGGDGRIYYQLSSSNRIPPETPVRIRLSGKRSTIASEFLAKQANPPKTVAEAMTKLPEQLREEYHAKGYHFARIEATLVTEKPVVSKDWSPSQFPTAVIYVNEGPRVVQAVWSDPTQQKGTLHVELHKNLSYDHLSKALFHHYWRKGCFAVEFSGRAVKVAATSPETTAYQVKIDHGWPSVLGGLQVHPVPPEMMHVGLPKDFPAKMGERFGAAQIEAACQTLHQWFAQHGYPETSIQVSFDEFRRSKHVQAHFFVQGPKLTQQPNGQSLRIGQVMAAAEPTVTVSPVAPASPDGSSAPNFEFVPVGTPAAIASQPILYSGGVQYFPLAPTTRAAIPRDKPFDSVASPNFKVLQQPLTRSLQDVPLDEVLREWSTEAGVSLFWDQTVLNDKSNPSKKTITHDVQKSPFAKTINDLLRPHGLELHDLGEGLLVRKLPAQTPTPLPASDAETPKTSESRYDFQWHDQPLKEVVQEIAKATGQTLILEEAALAEVGLTLKHPVHMAVKNLTTDGVIKALVTYTQLAIRREKDFLVLTSPDRAAALVVRTYPVADLIIPLPDTKRPAKPSAKEDPGYHAEVQLRANRLIDLLTAINPESWERSGGRGTMQFHEQTYSLVVRQTDAQHDAFSDVLDQLRRQLDFQVSLHVQRRIVTAEEWKKMGPGEIDRFVMLPETPSEGASISITTFNAQRISFDSVGIASVDVMGVIAPDRRSVSLSLFPANTPSLFQPLVANIEDGKTILVDISQTLPPSDPDRKDGSRVVLQVTPKIIVQAEEEERLESPQK